MIKYGDITTETPSEADHTKKAAYYGVEEDMLVDKENKHLLKNPVKIKKETDGSRQR